MRGLLTKSAASFLVAGAILASATPASARETKISGIPFPATVPVSMMLAEGIVLKVDKGIEFPELVANSGVEGEDMGTDNAGAASITATGKSGQKVKFDMITGSVQLKRVKDANDNPVEDTTNTLTVDKFVISSGDTKGTAGEALEAAFQDDGSLASPVKLGASINVAGKPAGTYEGSATFRATYLTE